MKAKMILLSSIKANADNPRKIDKSEFEKLKKSIQTDPELLTVRPLVLNSKDDYTLLAGEQRFKALLDLGYSEMPEHWVLFADNLTEAQKKKFILIDNYHAGTWDIEKLNVSWDIEEISDWGISIPEIETFSIKTLEVTSAPSPEDAPQAKPSATHDNYSVFELVMLHENKVKLLEVLNKVKNEKYFEKLEESLMHVISSYPL